MHKIVGTTLIVLGITVSSLLAGEVTGWRGDGSGIYPKANPPSTWSVTSKAVQGLRYQTEPPKGDAPSGKPMLDGVIREWLVLGPIDSPREKGLPKDATFAEDQSKLAPEAGLKSGDALWHVVTTDTAYIDFAKIFDTYGKDVAKAAYAHAYVYSPAEQSLIINVTHMASVHFWINGTLTHKAAEPEIVHWPQIVKFRKGWNRVLIRSIPAPGGKDTRPIGGTWYVNVVFNAPPAGMEYDTKNVAWKTPLPSTSSFGAPIVVGGKIYVLSEPSDLVCLNAATGKILWVRSNNYNDVAGDEDRKAHADEFKNIDEFAKELKAVNDSFATDNPPKAENDQGRDVFKKKVDLETKLAKAMKAVDGVKYALPAGQDVGYAGVTPVSDGKYVYAWFPTGVTCCYDLDGKLAWRRLDNEGSFFEHGYSTSPILADGKLIVFMNKMIAFDAAKGDRLWTTALKDFWGTKFHGTPAAAMVGKTPVCILPTGQILQLSDGKMVYEKGPAITPNQQEIPSPVVVGSTVYKLSTLTYLVKSTLPAEFTDPLKITDVRQCKMDLTHYPTFYLEWHMSSPLIHDGLAYCLNNSGVLSVIDVEKMQVVYEKLLDIDHLQHHGEGPGRGVGASLVLAGGNIYCLGNTGTTIVLKPGRTFEQVSKNRIESIVGRNWGPRPERFVASPVADGKALLLRGERYLYCVRAE